MERKRLVKKKRSKNKLLKVQDSDFKELIVQMVAQRGTIAAMAIRYGANREWLSRRILQLFGVTYRVLLRGGVRDEDEDEEGDQEVYYNPVGVEYQQLILATFKVDPEHAAWMARVSQDIKARKASILRVRSSALY